MTRTTTPLSRREEARVRLFAEWEARERRARARKMFKAAKRVAPKAARTSKAASKTTSKTSATRTITRTSATSTPTAKSTDPAAYTTDSKETMRNLVLQSFAKGGNLIYLDGPRGEATAHFLTHKVPPACLRPVNRDAAACAEIRATTGVRATHTCIFALMERMSVQTTTKKHTVWLDLEQNKVPREQLRAACEVARVLHLTLTCRGERPMAVLGRAEARVQQEGLQFVQGTHYRGKSKTSNMVQVYARARV
jgi:hypothetical protein